MINKRTFKIPIYQGRLIIWFVNDLEEVTKKLGIEPTQGDVEKYSGGAFTLDGAYNLMFETQVMSPSIIAHESKHIVNMLFSDFGIQLDVDNDEPECYLLGWIVDKVHDAWDKLKEQNRNA